MYKNSKDMGIRTSVENFRQTCFEAINTAKVNYLQKTRSDIS